MQPKTSVPILRRVRFKTGQQLEVLRQYSGNDRRHIDQRIQRAMDTMFAERAAVGGFAFCIWDVTGASMTAYSNFLGPITAAQVPDFVHNLLTLRVAEDWVGGK